VESKEEMRNSIVVYGPPGTGKTENAENMRRFFKLKKVLDHHNPKDYCPSCETLIITNADVSAIKNGQRWPVRFRSVEEVKILMCGSWKPANIK